TVQHPSLMSVVARLDGDDLSVTLPSGETVTAAPKPTDHTLTCDYWGRPTPLRLTSGGHGELFSEHLGRDVRLAAAPPGAVVFGDPVTIVATASLDDLASRVSHPVEPARFRPTLAVATDEPYEEETWLGREVTAGGVRLRIGAPVPRCAVIDHQPTSGIRDARLLKTLAAHRPLNRAGEPAFGVYAQVLAPGVISS
ncbi:MAG: MOSC domain-containing protein, partial [Nocardioides sp.]|nr:MOSC domain-containing protein [Nocardioides sp.]